MKNKKILIYIGIFLCSLIIISLIGFKLITKDKNDYKTELSIPFEVDYDSDVDLDNDGLSNKEEKKYGTNALNADTDLDGLLDKEEVEIYYTDPLNKDTDGDGLTDYNEIKLRFDPLKQDTNGDGKKDSDEHSNYSFEEKDMIINVSGKGNIADTYTYIDYDTCWSKQEGAINKEYGFSSNGDIDELKVGFKFTEDELKNFNIDLNHVKKYISDNPNMTSSLKNTDPFTFLTGIGVCKVNKEDSSKCEHIAGTVDIEKQIITVTLDNYQDYVYIIGDIKELYYAEVDKGNSKLDKDNKDLILIADSGFDVKKDGFSFKNYCTNFAKYGHCYGMALFADLYYTNNLPLVSKAQRYKEKHLGIKIPFTYHNSYAYDLSDSHFSNHSNLYDYNMKINNFSSKFDEEKMQNNKKYEYTDVQLLNAVYQFHSLQGELEHFSSGGVNITEGLYTITQAWSYNSDYKWDGTVIIDLIAKRLKNKEAPLLFYQTGDGHHAINVTKLYRYNNKNKYRIYIYNNNYPGEEKWLDIEIGKKTCEINSNIFYVLKSPEVVRTLVKDNA